ncbi:proline-rich protein 18 [Oryzias melastigma]|uniref:proline-rich protein 18 n=1 Tax=Oryzias melastigma TaxID=30732 RepID=UPI000CF81325|nr:proline-rich protein 18 [Oryzias melastigma]
MAEKTSRYHGCLSKSPSFVFSSYFFQHFRRKREFIFYLLICVAKMPFIPPVSIARSVSGLTGKERTVSTAATNSTAKAKDSRESKGGSVKERLTLNLKHLGRKNPPKSHLPTVKGVSAVELNPKKRDRFFSSSQAGSSPTSTSGECLPKKQPHKPVSHSSVKSEPTLKGRTRDQEGARFTLTLTPEAVLLLQRRNSEKHQRSAARHAGAGGSASGNATDARRRRLQSTPPGNGTVNGRVTAKKPAETDLVDISSIVKVSLLNEKHKYDDVEYEEEDHYGVDEHVVLKCTEWLRGLENTTVTVRDSLKRSSNSLKSYQGDF